MFLNSFRQLWENWIFDGNSTGATLTKIVIILYYLKMSKEIIFRQNYLFHSSKEVFLLHNLRQLWENWIFDGNSTGRTLTKIVKILYYLKMSKEVIFRQNYLFHSSKEVFLHNLRQLWENWIFDGNSKGADLTKKVKILYYLKMCKEIIFWQNYLFHSSKEVFLHNFRQLWEIEFLTEIRQARTLQKKWKFCTILNCAKKIF